MKRVGRNSFRGDETFRGFPVMRELQEMRHIGMFSLANSFPEAVRDTGELPSDSTVPCPEVFPWKHRIYAGGRTSHEIRNRRKVWAVRSCGLLLSSRVFLPFYRAGGIHILSASLSRGLDRNQDYRTCTPSTLPTRERTACCDRQ